MKTLPNQAKVRGITLVEVLIVLLVLFITAAVTLPRLSGSGKSPSVVCLIHLKQIENGFEIYETDSGGKFPMQIPVAKGGTMEFIYSDHTFPHFQKLQKYGLFTKDFVCPLDKARQAATNYEALNDLNLSYFINADATTNNPARSIISGDRFIQANGQPINPGLFIFRTNMDLCWTPGLHNSNGNLVFTDGHVERTDSNQLNTHFQEQLADTTRLSIP